MSAKSPKFKTLTTASRQYGISVPQLKGLLQEAGYLKGREATADALNGGLARLVPIIFPETDGPDSFAVWEAGLIQELVANSPLAGREKLGIWSVSKATSRLVEAVRILTTATLEEADKELLDHWTYENWVLEMAVYELGRPAAGKVIEKQLRGLLDLAYRPALAETPDIDHARALIHAVIEWFGREKPGASARRYLESLAATESTGTKKGKPHGSAMPRCGPPSPETFQ